MPNLRYRLEARKAIICKGDSEHVFPELVVQAARSKGSVSTAFTHLLRLHGITQEEPAEIKKGKRRKVSKKSFHSIRHTAPSLMQELGVPQAVSQDVTGHESIAVHKAYTSTSLAARAEALGKLVNAVLPPKEEVNT